jgi:CheY-like chemotaxis protein
MDKVVVDLKMPGENGMVLIEELLRTGYLPGKLVVCSAYLTNELEKELNDRGVGILRKPFTVDELMQVVNGMLVSYPFCSIQ